MTRLLNFRRWGSVHTWTNRKKIIVVFLLVLVALVGIETFRYPSAFDDLTDGRKQILSAADLLQDRGLDITDEELAIAEERFHDGGEKIGRASRVLDSDPILMVASWLPWAGTQVDTARGLADIASLSGKVGVDAVAAIREFQRVRDTHEGSLTEKAVPVLDAIEPNVDAIESGLAAIQQKRENMPGGALVGPLSSAVAQLDDHLEELKARLLDYRRAAAMAPKVLGYDNTQTYLVLSHDNTEILGSGGFVLVYGFITFSEGRIADIFFDSVVNIGGDKEWPPTSGDYIEPPRPITTYLLRGWPMGLAETSWWPDFPTTARNAIDIYHVNNGSDEQIDGVIGINFFTLERLLEVTGPITIDQYNETVTAENATEKTLIVTHPEGLRPWEIDKYDFTGYLAEEVIDQTMNAESSKLTSFLSALQSAGREKSLLMYHSDPAVEALIEGFGWDGGIKGTDGDYVMVVDSSLRSTKLNLVVEPRIDLDVRLDSRGNANTVATINYSNDYTAWAQEQDPRLVQLVTSPGMELYGDYLRLLSPYGSRLQSLAVDGNLVGAEDIWTENSRTVFARYFVLPMDSTKEVEFTYVAPYVVDMTSSPYEYRLVVQKQPGTRAIPLTISLAIPPGFNLISAELDGISLGKSTIQVTTDLNEDRELVVRFK